MPVDPAAARRSVDELIAALHVDGLRSIRPVTHGLRTVANAAENLLEVDSVDILLVDDPARAGDAAGPTLGAILSVPVLVNGELAATLIAVRRAPHRWTPDEVAALEAYAALVGDLLLLERNCDASEPAGYCSGADVDSPNRHDGEDGIGTAWETRRP